MLYFFYLFFVAILDSTPASAMEIYFRDMARIFIDSNWVAKNLEKKIEGL